MKSKKKKKIEKLDIGKPSVEDYALFIDKFKIKHLVTILVGITDLHLKVNEIIDRLNKDSQMEKVVDEI